MIRVLVVLCCLLTAAIAMEFYLDPGDGGVEAAAAQRPTGQTVQHPEPLERSRDQWVAVLLARPLFAPDRKPVGDPRMATMGLPRLAGIITAPNQNLVIFQPADNRPTVVARPGQTVAGWEVTDIGQDGVSLRKAADSIVLRPRFNGAETAAAVTKPARSRWEMSAATGLLRSRWSNPQLQP